MELFARIGHEFYVLAVAMMPVLELRASVPLALGFGLTWQEAFLFSYVGNLLPIPLVILLSRKVIGWLKTVKLFQAPANWLERHIESKKEMVIRYSLIGLTVLVAIPLPGTGAWTGAMLASLLDLRMRLALPAIAGGVLIANILVTGVTYGLFG